MSEKLKVGILGGTGMVAYVSKCDSHFICRCCAKG